MKLPILCALLYAANGGIVPPIQTAPGNADWYKNAVIYQIYPRSFKDSNNDGIGDIQGIISKLDYLTGLGINAIWLSPIYQSPMVDGGYDISDYETIAEEYGTMDDFMELLEKAHAAGIKVILDLVPNHTSDLHTWFNQSVYRISPYEDYYVWHDGVEVNGTRQPPNNWLSVWKYSGWEWNEVRQQYYFHQFSKQQPDLNYRNPLVPQAIEHLMSYWLDMGVDGFRVDAVPHIFEDASFKDEPVAEFSGVTDPNDWNYLDHIYTKDQNETFDLVYSWRDFLDNYTSVNGGDARIFMTECATSMSNINRYYGANDKLGAHFSFNFNLLGLKEDFAATDLFDAILEWFDDLRWDYTKNWLTGNHDNWRVASRVGAKYIDAFNMLITILPGASVTYMGEEIGQENGEVTCQQGKDPSAINDCTTFNQTSRDFERTPFQWDNTTNAGFDDGHETWLPVGSKYLETNVAAQENQEYSHLGIYKKMLALKPTFKEQYDSIDIDSSVDGLSVFRVTLKTDGEVYYHQFIFNVAAEEFSTTFDNGTVLVQTGNVTGGSGNLLTLQRGDAVLLQRAD